MKAFGVLCVLAVSALAEDNAAPGEHVVAVTADNFQEEVVGFEGLVIVEFYAPWCGHCKSMAADYNKAAGALKGKPVKLAAVDATVETSVATMFGVGGFPTIVYHPHGKKEDEDGIIYETYNSERSADGFMDFARDELLKSGIDITEILEVTGQDVLDECVTEKYCALFVLPHVVETGAEGRNTYIETIKTVSAELGRSNPTKFVWMQAGSQETLEALFNIGSYPSMVAINNGRTRFANHIGGFKPKHLVKTLKSIQAGRMGAKTYKTLPATVTNAPWDGKDYVYAEEEE